MTTMTAQTTHDHRPTTATEDLTHVSSAAPGPVPSTRSTRDAEPARSSAPDHDPVPLGWGTHEDRRLMRWGVVGFVLLAAYAVVFVLIGEVGWT